MNDRLDGVSNLLAIKSPVGTQVNKFPLIVFDLALGMDVCAQVSGRYELHFLSRSSLYDAFGNS